MVQTNEPISAERTLAMVLLVREIGDQLDEIAHLRSKGHTARIGFELLREMCEVLRELDPELQELYFELLHKLFGRSAPNGRKIVSDTTSLELLSHPRRKMLVKLKSELGLQAA